jgi:hypothetical protein
MPAASAVHAVRGEKMRKRAAHRGHSIAPAVPPDWRAAAPIIYAFLMDYYIAGLTAGATKG